MTLLGVGGNRAWALLGLGLLTACGTTASAGSSSTAGTSATGGTGQGGAALGGGSTASGASTGGQSGGGAPTGGADGSEPRGMVQIGQLFGRTPRFEASARFFAKDAERSSDCEREAFGDCAVTTCTPNGKTPTPAPYAGTITISDGADIDLELTTTPGETYSSQASSGASLSGRELFTVTASGAEVPAFTAEIAVPLVITVSAPALDANGMAAVPSTGDLILTFDNRSADGESGTKLVATSTGAQGSLYCVLPTETGMATIPAAALAKVRGGGQLLLLTTRTKQVTAGAFNVSVATYISAMNPDKSAPAILTL